MDEDFVEWCIHNGWQSVVQKDLDRRNAEAYGASIFSQPRIFFHKRRYYREVYLQGEHWHALRQRKLEQSPVCEHCGKTEQLEPHHLRYKNLYDVSMYDLVTLCRRCHEFEHAKLELQQQETWTWRVTSIAAIFRCPPDHVEDVLARMGLDYRNLIELAESKLLKFGMFNTAFSTRPIGQNRMAFLTLCGKRDFNQQKPPAEISGCVHPA